MSKNIKSQCNSWLRKAIFAVSIAVACFSSFMIFSILITGAKEQRAFDALAAIVEQEKLPTNVPDGKPQKQEPTLAPAPAATESKTDIEPVILPEYTVVYEQNDDFFGWLRIDDTPINYPVMYTPDDPQYYLHRAFDQRNAQSGTPFLDGACYTGCGNYILYGHRMNNGTMFGTLSKYADKAYWENHKTICFDTLYEHGNYVVIAAFYGKNLLKNEQGFRYYQYTDLNNPDTFEEYMALVKEAAIYDTGIAAEYGDELITLSTCSYHTIDGRFVVVARKNKI